MKTEATKMKQSEQDLTQPEFVAKYMAYIKARWEWMQEPTVERWRYATKLHQLITNKTTSDAIH